MGPTTTTCPRWKRRGFILIAVVMATAMFADAELPPQQDQTAPTTRAHGGLARPILGFSLNVHHISDLPLYLESVDRIAAMGANALNVVTPWFVEQVDSTEIRHVPSKCPTTEQLLAIFERADEHGLQTSLLPIVLIENPGEKDWRGTLSPSDWDAWWQSYATFADWFTQLAIDAGVDLLAVGSELNSTEGQPQRWMALVDRIRERYHGPLTYSANWDRYHKVRFWGLVDVISVSAYFELCRETPGALTEEIIEAWEPIRDDLLDFARRWDKPLILSELGYPSLAWANAHPWNYVPEPGMKANHRMQARCWDAFFQAWSATIADPRQRMAGFFGYHWDPYHKGQSHDTGYGILGKPAFGVIRRGFADIRESAARLADESSDGN